MRFTDGLSLCGVMLVLVLLLHAARHGPTQPLYEALALSPPALTATVDGAGAPPRIAEPVSELAPSSAEGRVSTRMSD